MTHRKNLILETKVSWLSGHKICQASQITLLANERLSIYRLYNNMVCGSNNLFILFLSCVSWTSWCFMKIIHLFVVWAAFHGHPRYFMDAKHHLPHSILVFPGQHHIMSNDSIVSNCFSIQYNPKTEWLTDRLRLHFHSPLSG